MPLLVAQRAIHGAALDHNHGAAVTPDQPLDFTMSKFKTSSRHQLYRQFYGVEDSPPYDKLEEQGNAYINTQYNINHIYILHIDIDIITPLRPSLHKTAN